MKKNLSYLLSAWTVLLLSLMSVSALKIQDATNYPLTKTWYLPAAISSWATYLDWNIKIQDLTNRTNHTWTQVNWTIITDKTVWSPDNLITLEEQINHFWSWWVTDWWLLTDNGSWVVSISQSTSLLRKAFTTSITRSWSTAYWTAVWHWFKAWDTIYVQWAVQSDYNWFHVLLTVPTTDTFTYAVAWTPTTPATWTITSVDEHSTLYTVIVPAQTWITLTDAATNYIYAQYNNWSPNYAVSTSLSDFNCLDKCIAYKIAREWTTLRIIDWRAMNVDANRKDRRRLLETQWFQHVIWWSIIWSNTWRTLSVTAWAYYYAYNKIEHPAFDTSSGTTMYWYYRNGSWGWAIQTWQTVLSNTSYDDWDWTLWTVSGWNYWIFWVYLLLDSPTTLAFQYGQWNYNTPALAIAATVPTAPPAIQWVWVLIWRAIVLKNAATFYQLDSSYTTVFAWSTATEHNGLSWLQWWAAWEYYHLTLAYLNNLVSMITAWLHNLTASYNQTWAIVYSNWSSYTGLLAWTSGQVLTQQASWLPAWNTISAWGLSWGNSITWTTWTWVTMTAWASSSALTILNLQTNNTQSNVITSLNINTGTSDVVQSALSINSITTSWLLNKIVWYDSARQAQKTTWDYFTFWMWNNFNTSNATSNTLFYIRNEQNWWAWTNRWIYIDNASTEYTVSSNHRWAWLWIYQSWAWWTSIGIYWVSNVNSSTNWLFNITLDNTQSAASTLAKLDLGTSAQAHNGLLVNAYNANTSSRWIKIDLWTAWTWIGMEIVWWVSTWLWAAIRMSDDWNWRLPANFIWSDSALMNANLTPNHRFAFYAISTNTWVARTSDFFQLDVEHTGITSWTFTDNYNWFYLKRLVWTSWAATVTSNWTVAKFENAVWASWWWTIGDWVNVIYAVQDADSTWAIILANWSWADVFKVWPRWAMLKTTTDLCISWVLETAAIYYNETSNYFCYCDWTWTWAKMNDPSTDCF